MVASQCLLGQTSTAPLPPLLPHLILMHLPCLVESQELVIVIITYLLSPPRLGKGSDDCSKIPQPVPAELAELPSHTKRK